MLHIKENNRYIITSAVADLTYAVEQQGKIMPTINPHFIPHVYSQNHTYYLSYMPCDYL